MQSLHLNHGQALPVNGNTIFGTLSKLKQQQGKYLVFEVFIEALYCTKLRQSFTVISLTSTDLGSYILTARKIFVPYIALSTMRFGVSACSSAKRVSSDHVEDSG